MDKDKRHSNPGNVVYKIKGKNISAIGRSRHSFLAKWKMKRIPFNVAWNWELIRRRYVTNLKWNWYVLNWNYENKMYVAKLLEHNLIPKIKL